jgi:hypothetical protein
VGRREGCAGPTSLEGGRRVVAGLRPQLRCGERAWEALGLREGASRKRRKVGPLGQKLSEVRFLISYFFSFISKPFCKSFLNAI